MTTEERAFVCVQLLELARKAYDDGKLPVVQWAIEAVAKMVEERAEEIGPDRKCFSCRGSGKVERYSDGLKIMECVSCGGRGYMMPWQIMPKQPNVDAEPDVISMGAKVRGEEL